MSKTDLAKKYNMRRESLYYRLNKADYYSLALKIILGMSDIEYENRLKGIENG